MLDVGKFVEGLLYGILEEQYDNIDQCIQDVSIIANDVEAAVSDFEKETFTGVKDGLEQIGGAVKEVPTAITACKQVTGDLTNLLKMAEIFEHPLTLIWDIGKSLVVNGV